MSNHLIASLIESISTCSGDLNEALLNTAFCFEKIQNMPSEVWPECVKDAVFDRSEVLELKAELVNFINTQYVDSAFLASAVWALGKTAEESDKEILISKLSECLNNNSMALYQIACVLGELGEQVLGRESSILDVSDNNIKVQQYIDSKGVS